MRLFISHAIPQDEAAKDRVTAAVIAAGHSVAELPPAGSWLAPALADAIRSCDACIWIASSDSLRSGWCPNEVAAFWGAQKQVVVLDEAGLGDADFPPFLRGKVRAQTIEAAIAGLEQGVERVRYHGGAENLFRVRDDDGGFEVAEGEFLSRYVPHTILFERMPPERSDGVRALRLGGNVPVGIGGNEVRDYVVRGEGLMDGSWHRGNASLHYGVFDAATESEFKWAGVFYVAFVVDRAVVTFVGTHSSSGSRVVGRAQWDRVWDGDPGG